MSAMPHKQVIGSAEAADILGINRTTLIRWVAAGRLTPIARLTNAKTGAHVFKTSDVERLAKDRNTPKDIAS